MNITKSFIGVMLGLVMSAGPLSAQENPGIFDSQTDIGNCKNKGFAFYNPKDQTYLLGGSGTNMWFGRDEFHYLWTTLQGDFILRAEVKFLGKGVNPHRKTGWIIRNTLDDNALHVNAAIHGNGLTSLQYRRTVGGKTEEIISPDSFPDVIQLERRGNTFIMSTARFGETFTRVVLDSTPLDHDVYVGIYVCAHDPDIMETALFRNVRIVRPAGPGLRPYHDYLGSHLEILDIESGLRKIIFSSRHSIQAPNWTVNGEKLIFNSKGHLFQYFLKNATVQPLNTGFAIHCNNDHVLTFDGSLLGISHHSEGQGGTSAIYYLPVAGNSTPVRVTRPGVQASYLHGWSPDNKKMVFTGYRNGQFDIYAVNINTGKETKLTNQPVLDDGPEFSPDGKYIFFNSARTGKMKLWRMDPAGTNKVQLTFDEYNDWFPHVSPDRRWIVFISYPKNINPQDHPFYKHCLLRIMPYEGGKPRVIAYIYGGQGTMNVPSWSPDSKKIAFVSNTDM